ncbi:hypothetical protein A5761_04805 [Mycolicibacterium setense]|uniref:Uncharacterized protein n=2 Tax=Mycolicibacterium setense TaxID=431269 RepID=A0ABR4Z1C0_9MYCO|nr:hypothetical protein QQ25_02980 [Mycolicibacterium setense]KHO28229.1 hypothetical protein QQ44_01430 [Mycolicibacterium setense]OBB20815.1 hypothetical protein A5761_04805 [Mycolicibacterium setense]
MTGVARDWTARREDGLWRRAVTAVRTALAAIPRPDLKQPYYPPAREGFVEDAAMAREMWRL